MTGAARGLFGAGLVGVALALRVVDLGALPLSSSEAATAWAALTATLPDGGLPRSVPASALLATLQWIAFGLLGAGETLARLPGAWAGTALAAVPLAFEQAWGRVAARSLAVVLALDPVLIGLSRSAEGAALGVPLAGALLLALLHDRASLRACAAPIAGLLVVSGFEAWSLLPLVLIVALASGRARALTPRETGLCAAAALLGATGLLAVPEFAGAVSASLTAWLQEWSVPSPVVLLVGAGLLFVSSRTRRLRALTLVFMTWALVAPVSRPELRAVLLALAALPLAAEGAAWLQGRATTGGLRSRGLALAAAAVLVVTLGLRAVGVSQAPSPDRAMARLAADVETLSAHRTPELQDMPVVLPPVADPALLWVLRGRLASTVAPPAGARPLVIARRGEPAPEGYVGQPYGAEPRSVVLWVPR